MKLEVAIIGSVETYKVIYDEGASPGAPSQFDPKAIGILAMPEWHPQFKGAMQAEDVFTLPNQASITGRFRQALDNIYSTVRARFVVPYATREFAFQSILTWTSLLQQHLIFRVTQDGPPQYFPDAVITEYDCQLQGATVIHTFAFESDMVTATAPSQ